jgi:hypothetical protein
VPEALQSDPVLAGECLSGALYWRDFEAAAREAGFAAPRLVSARPLEVTDPAIREALGDIRFVSATYRLFRLADRPGAEDYGHRARYRGGLEGAEEALLLDHATRLPAGESVAVSAETAAILARSRLAPFVDVTAGDGVHRGPFPAGDPSPFALAKPAAGCCG